MLLIVGSEPVPDDKSLDIELFESSGSWEQTAQERSKWRGLINKGATLYDKKRICEAERKLRDC